MSEKKLLSFLICCISVIHFQQSMAQGSFSLVAPANGAYTGITPYFDWSASSGATFYRLYIDGMIKKDNITTTYYQILPGEFLPQGLHTWYVVAVGAGTITSNEVWSVLIDATPPAAFNLVTPANNTWTTSLSPTFAWSESNDAQSGLGKYQLWIDGVLAVNNIPVTSTSTTLNTSLTNGSHTWFVKAVDLAGNEICSDETNIIRVDNMAPGQADNCIHVGGSYAISNNGISLNNYFTMEAWIKTSSIGSEQGIMDNDPTYLALSSDGRIYYRYYRGSNLWSGNRYTTTYFQPGIWYHIAISHDAQYGNLNIYVNGVLDASFGSNTGQINSSSKFNIGRASRNGYNYFSGEIDEIRVWSYNRSGSEIAENYDKLIDPQEVGLAGYWRCNDAFQSGILYGQVTGNNCTLMNGAYLQAANRAYPSLGGLCSLIQPVQSTYVIPDNVIFSWTSAVDAGIGLQKYQLWVDGNMVIDNLNDTTYMIVSGLTYGPHNWFVKGCDSLGNNQASAVGMFYIDDAKPWPFNLTAPTDNQIVSLPTPNLAWQPTSDSTNGSGLRKYQLWINGSINRDSIPVSQTTTSPINILPQGAYTWSVRAFDRVGNIRQSNQVWTFYIDWEPPQTFSLLNPAMDENIEAGNVTLEWQPAFDPGTGILKYELIVSGFPVIILTDTTTSYTLNISTVGNYTWSVIAYDRTNAYTSSEIRSFNIIPATTSQVHGTVTYDNSISSALPNIQVILLLNNDTVSSVITDQNGQFNFDSLPPDIYNLIFVVNKPSGGINAIDAQLVLLHYTEMSILTGLKFDAANVNNDQSVNAIDALLIGRRYLELIQTFPVGDWVFDRYEIDLTACGNFNILIKGICYGDLNGSYYPPPD